MKWQDGRQSNNIDDKRGLSGKKIAAGGGIGAIIILLISMFTGYDLSGLLQFVDGGNNTQVENHQPFNPDANDTTAKMISVVLGSTEDVWKRIFQEGGSKYIEPNLVLFTDYVQSNCGGASSEVGPFYCPADQKIYIDLSFCDELRTRFKAPGNFAVAYVVAHEVGHHIQNILGISEKVQRMRGKISQKEYNKLSVKLELQADFLAGVWAYHEKNSTGMIEPNDLEVALRAANAIGDDKLQKEAQGYVVPDAFTHGTSEQRMYWFKKGFTTGDLNQGKYEDIR